MDSTAHNFGVDEQVLIDLGTDHVLDELLCSTQPVLMLNRAIIDVLPTIESAVGKDKLYAKVMVNATTTHDTVSQSAISRHHDSFLIINHGTMLNHLALILPLRKAKLCS